jgi:type IV pilus assembly protein PilB
VFYRKQHHEAWKGIHEPLDFPLFSPSHSSVMSARLADILLKNGIISAEQRDSAFSKQAADCEMSFSSIVVHSGYTSEELLLRFLSSHFGIKEVDRRQSSIDKSAIELLKPKFCRKHSIIPLSRTNNRLTLVMSDPSDYSTVAHVKFITGFDIDIQVGPESWIRSQIDELFPEIGDFSSILGDIHNEVELIEDPVGDDIPELTLPTEDAPVVKLVNAILADAIRKNASDIHIEPFEKTLRIRLMTPPAKLKNAIASRLKIMAALDIAERRLPQDGRIKLTLNGKQEMDFRVNILPTLFGEKIVLRLLDKTNLQLDMTKLGFMPEQLSHLKNALAEPHGMILVTGPTGSGKTTTLYSALTELNKLSTNICTAEDPIEFNIHGINQAQINEDIGFSFAAALRAFLRQDPDVIMVGEIRDYETAEIAIKASLTGHLVLSTLHTNDAPSTINRLLNMGVEPFLVASSINIIIAQRLARRICVQCKIPSPLNPEILVNSGMRAPDARSLISYHGKGCQACAGTGYKGRIALYEVMVMTDELREFVLNGASSAELKRKSISAGMSTLRTSALSRLKDGLTTLEEVLRVTAPD